MYSTSSAELFQAVASTTGQLIQDSFPMFYFLAGLLLCLFGVILIVKAGERSVRRL